MINLRAVVARVTVVIALLALTAPARALAQSSPFAPLPQPAPDTSTQAPAPSSTTTSDNGTGGLGTARDILLYRAGAALLAGMAWLIIRAARRRAPVEERASQPRGTHSPKRHARA